MKRETEMKYPHAANLFRFCRRVLDHKYGGIRVIDQDVGQILGFDPADCSHWKKGKKNIRSIQAMKSIADHLGVDEKLVVDVAAGDISEIEAYHEFTGYGSFDVDARIVESAKKEYYRKNAGSWSREKEVAFKSCFQTDIDAIKEIVAEIHANINFSEAPLYLPEVVAHYPDLMLQVSNKLEGASELKPVTATADGSKFTISYQEGSEMRPYMRYLLAKSMAGYFLPKKGFSQDELTQYAQHTLDVEGNIFASFLLAPENLIKKEMKNIDVAKDIVTQLAEVFWVSKSFINRRLKDILYTS